MIITKRSIVLNELSYPLLDVLKVWDEELVYGEFGVTTVMPPLPLELVVEFELVPSVGTPSEFLTYIYVLK